MSEVSDTFIINIYEERLDDENVVDLSSKELETVPKLKNLSAIVIYLQNNKLENLPEDFFPSLTCLMYLDLRDNHLKEIPKNIKDHQALTHLLLQNNCLTALPDELGTVSLKVLQVSGNPLLYPPEEIINAGKAKILTYLHNKHIESIFEQSQDSDYANVEEDKITSPESYNSVLHDAKIKASKLKVEFNEKCYDSDEEYYAKIKGKCWKLDKSRHKNLPVCTQSAKYLKPLRTESKTLRDERIRRNYFKDMALKKRKELLATTDKILQEKKTLEQLKNWRTNYRNRQFFNKDPSYRLDPNNFPYDTSPEFITLLTREDIEKDLPDKYRRTLLRRCRPTVPRKANNDVHLAMKIRKLFENLEALDLNRDSMTPRTEQKVLMSEIHKISEIKQKLMELSSKNMTSV